MRLTLIAIGFLAFTLGTNQPVLAAAPNLGFSGYSGGGCEKVSKGGHEVLVPRFYNLGNADTGSGFSIAILAPSLGIWGWTNFVYPNLLAAGSANEDWPSLGGCNYPGGCPMQVILDSQNQVLESNERDNTSMTIICPCTAGC